jgi:integrase
MTLIKDKRSGKIKARIKTAEGKTKTLSTGATSKVEARRIVKQSKLGEIEAAAKAGKLTAAGLTTIIAGRNITFSEAIEAFKAHLNLIGRSVSMVHSVMLVLKQFSSSPDLIGADLAKKPLAAVTEEMVFKFLNAADDRGAGWRQTQRSALLTFFEFCQAKGWMIGNPAKLVRVRLDLLSHEQKEKKERRPFTESEVKALLKETPLGSFWHSAIALGRYTGLRLGDVAKLEWATLSTPGKIIVWTDKRDRRVVLDLHPVLLDAISAIPPINTEYVFPEQRAIVMDVTKRANLSTQFRRICESLDIHGKTFHDLRSSYIVACKREGIEIQHIAQNVGHISTTTTRGYMPRD